VAQRDLNVQISSQMPLRRYAIQGLLNHVTHLPQRYLSGRDANGHAGLRISNPSDVSQSKWAITSEPGK
jgi:hypothetical protein